MDLRKYLAKRPRFENAVSYVSFYSSVILFLQLAIFLKLRFVFRSKLLEKKTLLFPVFLVLRMKNK